MIRLEAIWLACAPFDMRAGTETALSRVVAVFGEARLRHDYLFAYCRATRMKALVHDGIGVWLAARRLNRGGVVWLANMGARSCSGANSSTHSCSARRGSTWATPASSARSDAIAASADGPLARLQA